MLYKNESVVCLPSIGLFCNRKHRAFACTRTCEQNPPIDRIASVHVAESDEVFADPLELYPEPGSIYTHCAHSSRWRVVCWFPGTVSAISVHVHRKYVIAYALFFFVGTVPVSRQRSFASTRSHMKLEAGHLCICGFSMVHDMFVFTRLHFSRWLRSLWVCQQLGTCVVQKKYISVSRKFSTGDESKYGYVWTILSTLFERKQS